jgi:flagellar FliL protein
MADDEKDIAEDGGGTKKKFIIIGGAAALLLLAVGVVTFLLLGGDDDATEAEATEAGEQVASAIEESDPVYIKLDPVFVVNLPPGGPADMLQVAIQVMTRHPTVVDTLHDNDPMIRHHLLNLLEQQDGNRLLTLAGKEDLQTAVRDLLGEQLAALGEPGQVANVYFTQFVMQ